VIIPEMPEGVEHLTKQIADLTQTVQVIIPEMPEGVEHRIPARSNLIYQCDYS